MVWVFFMIKYCYSRASDDEVKAQNDPREIMCLKQQVRGRLKKYFFLVQYNRQI